MKTTLQGTAMDAKAGAVLLTSNGDVYYIHGMKAWKDSMSGKPIEVSGDLKQEQYIPGNSQSDSLSQGTEGMQMVIYNASCRVIK